MLECSICPVHTPPPSFLAISNMRKIDRAFWKNRSITECVLRKITFVDTKLRGIEATCIVIVIGDKIA